MDNRGFVLGQIGTALSTYGQDAVHASIEIQLFHLKKSDGTRFDTEKFYRAILSGDGDDYNDKVRNSKEALKARGLAITTRPRQGQGQFNIHLHTFG